MINLDIPKVIWPEITFFPVPYNPYQRSAENEFLQFFIDWADVQWQETSSQATEVSPPHFKENGQGQGGPKRDGGNNLPLYLPSKI